ncbi:hypothetical protein RSAG8_13957, partial [Rhizoctonia solani AG-8 WAC10335]
MSPVTVIKSKWYNESKSKLTPEVPKEDMDMEFTSRAIHTHMSRQPSRDQLTPTIPSRSPSPGINSPSPVQPRFPPRTKWT